ncbi:hypothetical protein JCM10908_003656 [Rhodotorula pacifica]|uniref:uncharacterized protein n=1 Tax=Rhodotorula pacifica TaxID=1495444 RepID=UPI00317D7FDF
MADQTLLSILRGSAPAPAAPASSRPPHSHPIQPSLSRRDSAVTTSGETTMPATPGSTSTGQPNPLEQLFRTFSQPRPANGSSSPMASATSPTPPSTAPATTDGATSAQGPSGGAAKDSAALLSLLRGSASTVSSPPPPPTQAPNQPATSPMLSPRGGNAQDLLGLLMAGGMPTSSAAAAGATKEQPLASPTATTTTRSPPVQTVDMLGLLGMHDGTLVPDAANVTAATTDASPETAVSTAAAAPPGPVFTFVSPFDFLHSTRSPPPPTAARTATRARNAAQPPAAPVVQPPEPSPTQLPTPTESVASPAPAGAHTSTLRHDFAFSPGMAPSPASVASTSEVSAAQMKASSSGAPAGLSFPHDYLASAYITSAPAPTASWAPLGVRLPRRASLPYDAPQHLTISTSDPHHEALVPSAPEVTPIALFSVPFEDRQAIARRRTAGIWEHGIAYASAGTGKHRIRVIDRDSGAKILLKGKKEEKEVIDLQVEGTSREGRRRIGCVSKGGALSVWQVPDRFDNEAEASQQSTRLLIVPSSSLAASIVFARFVPGQQRLYVVRADRVISVWDLSQPAAPPRDIRLIGGGEVVDIAFSPDAAYVAVLMSKSVVTFQLDNSGAQKKTALDEILPHGLEADQVAFVTPAGASTSDEAGERGDAQHRPLGLAISSAHSTRISIFPAQSHDGRLSLASMPTVQVEVTPPSEYAAWLFGQMAYHESTQSLVLSHSLRGSLFTFRLAFVEGPDGEPLIRINHVLEHPTPAPVLSFTLDSLSAADPHAAASDENTLPEGVRAASKIRYGALVVHPGGVHHVALIAEQPRQYAEIAPKHRSHSSDTSSDGGDRAQRRMSLEDSIHVSSEVEVTVEEIQVVELEVQEVSGEEVVQTILVAASVDEPDEGEEQQHTPAEATPRGSTTAIPPAPSPRPHGGEPALGDLSNGLPAAATPIAELSSAEASPIPGLADLKLSGPLVNAAIRNMKATRSGSPATATPASAAAGAQRNGLGEGDQRGLPAKIAEIVQQELQKTGSPSAELDTKLANLEQRLSSSLAASVQRQTAAAVMSTIQQVLPIELSRHLTHPNLVLELSEAVASNAAPLLERSLATQIVKAVVPTLDRQLSGAVEGVIDSIRQEMLDVRKEIVQEQSGAVSILEDEVANLREEVSTMKAMLEKMERLLMASAAAAATTNAASPRMGHAPLQSTSSRQAASMRHVSQPASTNSQPHNLFSPPQHAPVASVAPAAAVIVHALPPIPRASTPPARYEELFTDVMLPSHEPEFAALAQLIMSSPLSRLDAIFPPAPAVPSLTMPVVLSLAYRLSQLIANKDGPVDDADKRHLLWLRKAIAACDGKQSPEIVALVPRILQNVVDNLVVRGRRLMAMNDQAGAGEVRLVTQYAHARLTLFLQAGAEGPGVETFRR